MQQRWCVSFVVILLLLMASSCFAEETTFDGSYNVERRQATILEALALPAKHEAAFVELFVEYQARMDTLKDRGIRLLRAYKARDPGQLDDEFAQQILDNMFELRLQKLDIQRSFRERFSKVLTAGQLVLFFQLENRIDIYNQLNVFEQVPLNKRGE